MNPRRIALVAALSLVSAGAAMADTYGSVEPVANPAVIDTTALRDQPLAVRKAFADHLFQCGVVDRVIGALTSTGGVGTINGLNTQFDVAGGGFAGHTNPAYVYTVIDHGPNGATHHDISILTDSLGYVFSQGSAFLLDSEDTSSYDFPANYVVLNFPSVPTIEQSAALFETVCHIDPNVFETDTSGYTQYGRAYLSLESDVPDQEFINAYVQAAAQTGVEYTPVVNGTPSLFQGGAGFPGNDWEANPRGQEYLARIPAPSRQALGQIRSYVLGVTRDVLKNLGHGHGDPHDDDHAIKEVTRFACK